MSSVVGNTGDSGKKLFQQVVGRTCFMKYCIMITYGDYLSYHSASIFIVVFIVLNSPLVMCREFDFFLIFIKNDISTGVLF